MCCGDFNITEVAIFGADFSSSSSKSDSACGWKYERRKVNTNSIIYIRSYQFLRVSLRGSNIFTFLYMASEIMANEISILTFHNGLNHLGLQGHLKEVSSIIDVCFV